MRINDVHVEVRGRNLDGTGSLIGRQGTILNRDLDLKAKTRWCGVGEWELTLPGAHPMVPYLMAPGSGLVVNGPVGQTLHPREYTAWAETLRNRAPNPRAVSSSFFNVASGTHAVIPTGLRATATGGTANLYVYPITSGADANQSTRFLIGPSTPFAGRVRVINSNPTTQYYQMRAYSYAGAASTGGTINGPVVELAPGAETVMELTGVSSADPTTNGLFVILHSVNSSGSAGITPVGTTIDHGEWAVYTDSLPAQPLPYLYGESTSGELRRTRWLGTANASITVEEQRSVARDAYYETIYGPLFSGPTLTPARKRDVKNPDGTLTFKGVTDEIHLDDALAFPSPTIADPEAQTRANDDQAGPAETLLRYYVDANLTSAPAGRKGGFRDLVTVPGSDGTLGMDVAKSPRFQNLLELCQEIAITSQVGFRMVQVGDEIQFQIVPTRDLRKTIRLDVEAGTLNSEESRVQGPGLTRGLVAGQGEGTDRKILTVTTSEAAAAETTYGRIIERWINQSNTNDDAELTTKGLEELADAAGGMAVKALPADTTTMLYGQEWREGDWITVVINGQEMDSVVTEAVFSFTKDVVGVGAAIGDVSTFQSGSAERKKQNSLDSRVSYIERANARPALSATGAEVSDWNQATENGNYWGDGAANAPYSGMVMGQTLRDGSGRVVQEVLDPANLLYGRKRRVMVGGVWGAWKDVGTATLPQTWVGNGTSAYSVPAGTEWKSIPGALRLELPAQQRDLLLDVNFGALGSTNSGYWMIGVSVFNADNSFVIPPENADPTVAGTTGTPLYGIYAPFSQTTTQVQLYGSKRVMIPAGIAATFQMAVRKNVAGAAVSLNYSSMQITPERWV